MAGAQGSKGNQHKKTLSGEVHREDGAHPHYSKGLASHYHTSTNADQRIEARNNPNANRCADSKLSKHRNRNPKSKQHERERNLVQHVASCFAAEPRLIDEEDRLVKQSRSASSVEPSELNPRIRASRKFSSKNPLYLALPLPGVDHEKDKYPSQLRAPSSSGRLRSIGVPVTGRLVQNSPRHHHRDGRHYGHYRRHHGHSEGHRRRKPPSRPSVRVPGKWTPTQEHLVDARVDYKEISLHSVYGSWKPPRVLL